MIADEYLKYDYLNKAHERPLVKILINYIRPSFLFKSEILTPMHLGRAVAKEASKDGVISDEDLKWLYQNCIGDDFEGGISEYNRRIGFLTGTYWAWKNYEKLGNPEYFGSFGYRRLFAPSFLAHLKEYDLIVPEKRHLNLETIREQFIRYHGKELFERLKSVFVQVYPDAKEDFEVYFEQTSGYFDEIYVMKKEIFFDFCQWIFRLLFAFLKETPIKLPNNDLRDIGFMAERLTGYYLNQLILKNKLKYYEAEIVLTEKMVVNRSVLTPDLLERLRKNLK